MSSAEKMADSGATPWDEEVVSLGLVDSAEQAGLRGGETEQAGLLEDPSEIGSCTLSSIRDEINLLRREIVSRDVLLQKLEESVTRLAEDFTPLKNYVLANMQEEVEEECSPAQDSSGVSPQLGDQEIEEVKKMIVRERCIEAMMSFTKILENDEEKTLQVKGWYEQIYDAAPETSYILRILEKNHKLKMFIDCDYNHIGRLINRIVDYDGNKLNGTLFPAFTDFMDCKIYAAGKPMKWHNGHGWVDSQFSAVLAECFTQFAMSVIFKNKYCPYACDDKLMEKVYEKIVEEALSEQSGVKILSFSFERAHRMKTQIGKEVMLISAILAYLVQYGCGDEMSSYDGQLHFLYLFFKLHVVPKMMDYLRE